MVPLATPVITKAIGSFFGWLGIRGIIIVFLSILVGSQMYIIKNNRETITTLKVEVKQLKDKLDEISEERDKLQDRIDTAEKKNRQLSKEVGQLKEELRNRPIPKDHTEMMNEIRETNKKAIELWKR